MGPEAIVTIIGVAVIVGALAAYLIIIAGILVKVSSNLSRILNEVILDIANKTGNVGPVVQSIANDVANIEQSMASLSSGGGGGQEEEEEEQYMVEEEYVEEEEPAVAERPRRRRRVRATR